MISDSEVQESRGYGLVVNSTAIRSVPVWERKERPSRWEQEAQRPQVEMQSSGVFRPRVLTGKAPVGTGSRNRKSPRGPGVRRSTALPKSRSILIRRIISDQLAYINIAKEWFTTGTWRKFSGVRLAMGRIGGKAAGMLLAASILNEALEKPLRAESGTPNPISSGPI